ncbi:MAG: flagellar hook-basal body complex protein [Deltaproteobacteria bacterium]|nr:flagellar hook-basal body complex protein [Deltaproteobacteria bacterium]
MAGAITIATTGLTSSSKQMDVIGNNLANSSTLGYKAGNTYFAAVLNQSLSGSGALTVGQGVEVSSIATQFSQGSFETTSSTTDLAIDGDGFFIVEDADGARYYTRAGNFNIDKDGYLVDNSGYKVQGFPVNSSQLTEITLANVQSEPSASTEISIGANLDSTEGYGESFNVSQNVFDSLGGLHNLSITFLKTEGSGMWGFEATLDGTNVSDTDDMAACGLVFDSDGLLDSMYMGSIGTPTVVSAGGGTISASTVDKPGQIYQDATGIEFTKSAATGVWDLTNAAGYENAAASQSGNYLYVDLDGKGGTDLTFTLAGTWAANDTVTFDTTCTSVTSQDLLLSFGALETTAAGNVPTIGVPEGSGSTVKNIMTWDIIGDTAYDITGYASTSVVKSLNSDGYASGVLKSLAIEGDGEIYGVFTNGQTSQLGQIILANFPNISGLKKVGNYFAETNESGAALANEPGSGGLGEVLSNSLEISNTDVAKEFINMITAQRAYQANARVITTANDMLTELMNIKR